MIAVIDSGIWVSALEFGGTPRLAVERVIATGTIAFCKQIEVEVVDVLARKFGRPEGYISARLRNYLHATMYVDVPGVLAHICRDPKDDFALECAQLAQADFLITGDKDLLVLQKFGSARILSPRQFLDLPSPA